MTSATGTVIQQTGPCAVRHREGYMRYSCTAGAPPPFAAPPFAAPPLRGLGGDLGFDLALGRLVHVRLQQRVAELAVRRARALEDGPDERAVPDAAPSHPQRSKTAESQETFLSVAPRKSRRTNFEPGSHRGPTRFASQNVQSRNAPRRSAPFMCALVKSHCRTSYPTVAQTRALLRL